MDAALCIKHIDGVYHVKSNEWQRAFFSPRHKDGIVLMLDGVNRYTFPSESVLVKKNNIVILPADIPYSGTSYSDGVFEGIVIDFECCEGTTISQAGLPYVMSVSDNEYFEMLFREILSVWKNKHFDVEFHLKSLLYKLVYQLLREMNGSASEKTSIILEYINNNLDDKNLSVSKICKKFFISESTLMRNVKKLTGLSPKVYISSQRLEKARKYVLYSTKSIKEISVMCGFASSFYFSNLFNKKYGCSPKNYRMSYLNKDADVEF
jgi:AraC-like DNA-binding protein